MLLAIVVFVSFLEVVFSAYGTLKSEPVTTGICDAAGTNLQKKIIILKMLPFSNLSIILDFSEATFWLLLC